MSGNREKTSHCQLASRRIGGTMQFDIYGEKPGHQEGQEACSSGTLCIEPLLKKAKVEI